MISKEPAVIVKGLHKSFKLPHEKHTTLKQAVLNLFKPKTYEQLQALVDVSFEIKKGEFFGIVGRNGSGKSTLLKTIAGIYQPDQGDVYVDGKLTPFIELGIGFNPELTGRDNVFLNGVLLGLTHKEVAEKYEEIVEFAELGRFMDQKLKNYSSGMQVRLAFSVAIQAHNDILLMDEVLAVGDANFQQKCFEVFKKLKKAKKTIIFVSHDLASIEEFCDRVAIINKNELVMVGKPGETVSQYRVIMSGYENPAPLPGHVGTGEVLINKVELLVGAKATKVLAEGTPFKIKFHFSAEHKVANPVFGLAINDKNGRPVIGPNTRESGFSLKSIKGQGNLTADFKENLLTPGHYSITVSCFDDKLRVAFDYVDNIYQFQVTGEEKHGVVHVEPSWKA